MSARSELDEKMMRAEPRPLAERLEQSAAGALLGRERELALLMAQLAESGAVVTFLHGIGGIGKTSLLAAAEPLLVARGARVLRLDGRLIEPTPRGFLKALSGALAQRELASVDAAALELEQEPAPSVVMMDEYDHLRLLDAWLRHTLLPALPERTRWILAGRFGPQSAWLTTPGWSEAVLSLRLGALDEPASRALLARRGVPEAAMPPLLELARGTPLALTLAAPRSAGLEASSVSESAVLATLAQRSVEALAEPLREALEAASVVRRATRPLLEAMLGRPCDSALFAELGELSFVEHTSDGFTLHETVRHALAAGLSALDPARYLRLRRAAWRALESMLAESLPVGQDAWRLTADTLFIAPHPTIREAFFPTEESGIVIDLALPADHAPLLDIVRRHEPPAWEAVFEAWWQRAPGAFRVARDAAGRVLGFVIISPADEVPAELEASDALLAAWQRDVATGPGRERGALFMRRAVAAGESELKAHVRAAIWVDVKRSYVERPGQWALYVGTRHAQAQLPLLARLGFEPSPLAVDDDETLRLEFGAAGIWSWLRGLVNASDLGKPSEPIGALSAAATPREAWRLDPGRRALWVDGAAVPLSALEYRVLALLLARAGEVVTRNELLEQVWEQRHTGSNVVEAVVRLLRKKLGAYAAELETVRGHGYRIAPRM